ncbi:PREDICTED: dimethylaniline monooxygenase [N-oxide-forming] 5-like [Elephantulus edwardii]|uniref:dimethylaniline monooxygenase [N-oxide-forming] 5-like n=1 Tax=Elephantulus edwardii TaxID=28737 RepID=UPI0003F06898|nr:PREDICTED: dimethylaniline monooxygenase [N-oxide-forming] 5-like [Elephantulus edwardii]
MDKKRIAVIGAGISGLGAIKCCLDEDLEPTCFERNDDIGGLWKFQKSTSEKLPSIYRSVTINTSKEMMCFSDFPIPDHFPNYMHNSKLMDYFRMYAKHFDLLKYIRFKTKVRSVRKHPDFSLTGQWEVVVEANGQQETLVFNGVLVCSGHHTDPYLPLHSFPGIEKFEGCYFHSREYKSPEEFLGKRIIVVGIGNSGVDIAVELSRVAKQVFLSTRRGAWILHRVWENGYPMDTAFFTRFNSFLQKIATTAVINNRLEKILNSRFNHAHYGLQPKHRPLSQHPTVNDDLPNHIISGKVCMKPNVKEFTETDAIFDDGTIEEKIDVVIFATGYSFSFPFLDGLIKVSNNEVSLYKLIFPPDLEKPTLAVIGLIQPLGIILPIAELQSRWATRVFKGLSKLPSERSMMAEIAQRKKNMNKRYVKTPRHTIQVDHIEYMDEIASLAGVKPNLLLLFLSDPKLAMEVFFGPCTPYQYRLQGPGKWDGARRAILTQRERIIKPLRTRITSDNSHCSSEPSWIKMAPVGLAFLIAGLAYFRYIHYGKRK